jgi:hypothetical protein
MVSRTILSSDFRSDTFGDNSLHTEKREWRSVHRTAGQAGIMSIAGRVFYDGSARFKLFPADR